MQVLLFYTCNKCKLKMLKDAVPKTRETREVYKKIMVYNNNTMCNPIIIKRDVGRGYIWYYCCMP